MNFWGVEVKARESLKIKPKLFNIHNITQVALGEVKDAKGAKQVTVHLKVDDEKYVIATLSSEDRPHSTLDLVFEKEFELSHDWKDGSIYFCGCISKDPTIDHEVDGDLSDEDKFNPVKAFGADEDDNSKDETDDSVDDLSDSRSEDLSDSLDDSSDGSLPQEISVKKKLLKSAAQSLVPPKKAKLATPQNNGNPSAKPSKKAVRASGKLSK